MATIDYLVTQAASLSTSEISELVLRLQALGAVSSRRLPEDEAPDVNVLMLYDAICRQMQQHLRVTVAPAAKFFTVNGQGHTVHQSIKAANAELSRLVPNMTRIERASVSALIADLVVSFIQTNKIKNHWFGVSLALKDLPALLDQHFPGYASNNLLRLVLQLRTQKKRSSNDDRQPE